nr:butyrophilin-like protein 1 isoform X3 [Labrus bergylta]
MEITEFHFFFFCCVFTLFSRNDGLPVSAGPVTRFSLPGGNVVLPCRPASPLSHDLVLEWLRVDVPPSLTLFVLRDGEELKQDKDDRYVGRTALTDGYSLSLLDVQSQDNGTYSCVFWRGTQRQHQESVSLIVARVSEVNISTSKMPSNELLVVCESCDWYPPPQVFLLDSTRKDLHALTKRSTGRDGLVSFSATLHLNKATLTGNRTVICRVEIPEMNLVRESQIDVGEHILRKTKPKKGSGASEDYLLELFGSVETSAGEMEDNKTSEGKAEAREVFPSDEPLPRVHADIMNVETTGTIQTVRVNRLSKTGVEASEELADRDLTEMEKYKEDILFVGKQRGVHPALIAAIISRQSQAGTSLSQTGYGTFDHDCFGLMQINKLYHKLDERTGPFSREHLDQGAAYLRLLIDTMRKNTGWTAEQNLKGAVACYIAGPEKVIGLKYDEVDSVTPNNDFANDVIARAQWYAKNHFKMS